MLLVTGSQGSLCYTGWLAKHRVYLSIPHKAGEGCNTRWLGAMCITRHIHTKHKRWNTRGGSLIARYHPHGWLYFNDKAFRLSQGQLWRMLHQVVHEYGGESLSG